MDPEIINFESDNYIDYKGKKADQRKHGGLRAATLACVVEIMETLITASNGITLVDYFFKSMHYSVPQSSNMVTNFIGTAYLLSIVWGFISDSYITKFTTFVSSGVLQLMGLVMLTYQAKNPNLQPQENKTPSFIQTSVLHIGHYSLAIGIGGVRSTLAAHGADQLDQNNKTLISTYFSWYFFSFCTGSLLATCGMVLIEQKYGFSTSFMIMIFISTLLLCTFVSGYRLYRYKRPSGSSVTRIIQVIVASIKNINVSTDGGLNQELLAKEKSNDKFKFLNKALMNENIDVKETKTFLGLLPIFVTTIMMNCCLAQIMTFSIQQGNLMNRTIFYNFTIPTQYISIVPILISLTFISIFEKFKKMEKHRNPTSNRKVYKPLYRVGMGLALVATSMLVASIIESKRLKEFKNGNILSVLWLLCQYILIGLSETLTLGGMLEFFYSEAPQSMRSMCTSLSWLSTSMGMFTSSVLVSLSNYFSGRFGGTKWFGGGDLNHSRLDLFYGLLFGINFFNFLIYVYIAKRY